MATFDHVASDYTHPNSGVGSAFGTNPTAGNTLIVAAAWSTAAAVPTIASSNGNVYTLAASVVAGGNGGAAVWVANNCNGGAETVTLTQAGQAYDVTKSEYTKGTNVLQADQVASAEGSTANPNSGNTPSTIAANELVYGFASSNSSGLTAGSGFLDRANGVNNVWVMCEDKVVSSIGAQAAAFTKGASSWSCICVTLMETPAGGTPSRARTIFVMP